MTGDSYGVIFDPDVAHRAEGVGVIASDVCLRCCRIESNPDLAAVVGSRCSEPENIGRSHDPNGCCISSRNFRGRGGTNFGPSCNWDNLEAWAFVHWKKMAVGDPSVKIWKVRLSGFNS